MHGWLLAAEAAEKCLPGQQGPCVWAAWTASISTACIHIMHCPGSRCLLPSASLVLLTCESSCLSPAADPLGSIAAFPPLAPGAQK